MARNGCEKNAARLNDPWARTEGPLQREGERWWEAVTTTCLFVIPPTRADVQLVSTWEEEDSNVVGVCHSSMGVVCPGKIFGHSFFGIFPEDANAPDLTSNSA